MKLTPAQNQIVWLMREGKNLKEIAHELGKSYGTVRKQALAARDRSGCRSNAEMAVRAHETD